MLFQEKEKQIFDFSVASEFTQITTHEKFSQL